MTTASPTPRVVVIGGGITGLPAAYRLRRLAQTQAQPLDVLLLEVSDRLGGVIATQQEDDLLMEQGPDCFLAAKPWGTQLCAESLNVSGFVARKHWPRSWPILLAIAEPIMCQKARLLDADSLSWTPTLTFYKLLAIERC